MSLSAARGFASDNSATIHPDVLAAIARVNAGHAFGYGHDEYTLSVEARVASAFGDNASAFFVFNGTGANVLSLRAACRRFEAVICAETAHLNVDECGAPEVIAGVKVLTVPGIDGKLTPELVESRIARVGDEHAVQPHLVSISQCTELGTLYTPAEMRELADVAHSHDLLLHVDGARLSNAAAALGLGLREAAAEADVISFGGTKNGLLGAEAVVLLTPELAQDFLYVRKQSMQLASKMRFLAAQFDALISDELWLRNARHANTMAARLADAVSDVPGVQITRPVQANAVFAIMPSGVIASLQREYPFYVWDEAAGEVRWMCSWDTTEEDVEGFATAVRDALASYAV
ncbi:MAG TPA: low specificity L-threonine aldolase [Solirubrobacteraceae bacterium]|nr:low specificity L-threonine aldolase [Solirubrobacteraceae bacterium]